MFSLQLPQHPPPQPDTLSQWKGWCVGEASTGWPARAEQLSPHLTKDEPSVSPLLVNSLCGLELGIFSL